MKIYGGPSIRNSIMMSNQARGFKHISLNSTRPLKSLIGWIEFQLVSGRLESSGYTPPNQIILMLGLNLMCLK